MFALRFKDTKNFVFFMSTSNDGDFCVGVSFELDTSGEGIWVVDDRQVAEYAATHSSAWYNASYSRPSNEFIGLLEVVELAAKE